MDVHADTDHSNVQAADSPSRTGRTTCLGGQKNTGMHSLSTVEYVLTCLRQAVE